MSKHGAMPSARLRVSSLYTMLLRGEHFFQYQGRQKLTRVWVCSMSFDECDGFVDDICRVKYKDSRDVPILVIGNKNDRAEDKQVF